MLNLMGLREKISKLEVSVLPDFFHDRIVSVPNIHSLFGQVELKARAGGGNLRGFAQVEVTGGNATNLAFALSSLSVRTHLYCVGNSFTRLVTSGRPRCQVRIMEGEPGYTTALEFNYRGKPVNVMLSDVGGLSSFDGGKLRPADIRTLEKSDGIALTNWSANGKGNELAKKVFSLKGRKQRLNFLDPADMADAKGRIKILLRDIVDKGLIDVISLNENEARVLAHTLSVAKLRRSYGPRDLVNACNRLHNSLHITVDLHTPMGSATSTSLGGAWAHSFGKAEGFITGAGDVWDAGDIIGHLLHSEVEERLQFANAAAYLYLRRKKRALPTLQEITNLTRRRRD